MGKTGSQGATGLQFLTQSRGGCFGMASHMMSGMVFAFAVLMAICSTMQTRAARPEQLDTDLENLRHQWPQLVKSFCRGKRPDNFWHSEVGSACKAGILTTVWIQIASFLVMMQGGPPDVFHVCLLFVVLHLVVCVRAHADPAWTEGIIFLWFHNVLEFLLVWQMAHAFDKA